MKVKETGIGTRTPHRASHTAQSQSSGRVHVLPMVFESHVHDGHGHGYGGACDVGTGGGGGGGGCDAGDGGC